MSSETMNEDQRKAFAETLKVALVCSLLNARIRLRTILNTI